MTDLPIHEIRRALLAAPATANRFIVTAPTGSGKSTQVPQYLLDAGRIAGLILVLQPRRLAARMLAERVAFERGSATGAEIGYQTRFDSKVSAATRVRFITQGILPRLLLADPCLTQVGAVLFDEFHERSLTTDLSLALLRQLQEHGRPELKLVVMSATLDVAAVSAYLGDACHFHAEGRLYPIDIQYTKPTARQEPWERAAGALDGLLRSGAAGDVLIFMPGVYEIRRTIESCRRVAGTGLTFLPLYGDLPGEQQHQVMAPGAMRKVIVATNIAETSLTIPGVRHVIDSGLARVSRFDASRGFNTLFVEPVSRDAADQRSGRAGREGPGVCVRLWTTLEQNHRPARREPEIGRVDLAEAVLQTRLLGFPRSNDFPWFEAPSATAITAAEKLLTDIGALRRDDLGVTPLGQKLAEFPVHPRLARLFLEAAERGCLRGATMVAAILTERAVLSPAGRETAREQTSADSAASAAVASDFFAVIDALHAARSSHFEPDFCARRGINPTAARQVFRTQAFFLQGCHRQGLGVCRTLQSADSETSAPTDSSGKTALNLNEFRAETLQKTRFCLEQPVEHGQKPCTNAKSDRLLAGDSAQEDPEQLLQCILLAYPDHLARRRDRGTLLCELRDGRRGELVRTSVTRDADLLVAAEIREVGGRGRQAKIELSLASEIRREWLTEHFPENWRTEEEIFWNEPALQVERRRRVFCLDVLLEEKELPDPDPRQAGDLLARKIIEKKLPLRAWTDDVNAWIGRVRWVAEMFPERGLIRYDDADTAVLVHELCTGESRYARVKDKPVLQAVRDMLSYDDQRFVTAMAPEFIELPTGRRMRLRYRPGQPPRGSARLQELYDLRQTPRLAGGRAGLLLEILAPNMRPVQITEDLAGFWEKHYPAVKKALARRYPKHEWR